MGSENGLSPGRCQAIIGTNAGILLIGPLETNFSEISNAGHKFSFKETHLKASSAICAQFCLYLNVLKLAQAKWHMYRKTSNISHTLVGNKIVDHSDVVGASPVGAAPTTSSVST